MNGLLEGKDMTREGAGVVSIAGVGAGGAGAGKAAGFKVDDSMMN